MAVRYTAKMTDSRPPEQRDGQGQEKWYGRMRYQVLLFTGGIALFVLVGGWMLDWYIAPQTSAQKKDLVQALGLLTAGVAGAVGIFFTWRGQRLTQESLEDTRNNAQENLLLIGEGQITERFTRAIDQLGSKELEVRLGGIYALERIASDSERDHWTIMEILTTYVRVHAPRQTCDDNSEGGTHEMLPIDPDIQAIITVIRRRKPSLSEPEPIDLHLTKLHKANLSRANLSGANLSGADLEDADLRGAYLRGADLREAKLVGAKLEAADLQFADLRGTDLNGAKIYLAQLQGADLRHLREGEPRTGYEFITAEAPPPPGPILSETTGLTQAVLSLAQVDEHTELPSDI
jgi:hypothetical protein